MSRTGNILFSALLGLTALRIWLFGPTGLCSFEGMSGTVANVVGFGLLVGALLLLIPNTAVVGLIAAAAWILLWTWMLPATIPWGGQPCSPSAFVVAGLFLNMGVMGLSKREANVRRMTELILFIAPCFLVIAVAMWLRGE